MVSDRRGEDRSHVDVGRIEAEGSHRTEQLGFRERHEGLGYARVNDERSHGRSRRRHSGFLAAANADPHTVRRGELLHRCPGILLPEHGGQQARRVDAVREHLRCRRDRQQDKHRAPVLLTGKRAKVTESAGCDSPAQRVQLADQLGSQPNCLFSIAAHGPQQQRLTTVGEGRVLSSCRHIVCFDRQGKGPVRYLRTQQPVTSGDIRHLPGLRLVQFVAPDLWSTWCDLGNLSSPGPCLPLFAQPVELDIPLRAADAP